MNYLLPVLVFMPIIAAIFSYIIGRYNKVARDYFADIVVIIEFAITFILFVFAIKTQSSQIASLSTEVAKSGLGVYFEIPGFAGLGLHFILDGFRSVYILVAAIMWMMTTIFSREYFTHYHNRNRYYMFMLLTLGATMGVFLSRDLYTTFIFFEMMSFTSYVWVAHDERKMSLRAAETYLAVAVIGGMVMLMGLFLLYNALGTLDIAGLLTLASQYPDRGRIYACAICISIGFGAKAGAFPLHIWLPKAHPVAPAPASALLSGILTKSGVYGLLVVSCNLLYGNGNWGSAILLVGTITMFGGALLALFSTDLKRTLACSSMSQIGFIMVGIGMQGLLAQENTLAARGTLLHMVNHSLIKLVLFMVAGVVYMNLHKLELNDIRGFGRKKPLFNAIFLSGALGIGGIPLFNGYVSKTLLHEGIVEYAKLLEEGEASLYWFSYSQIKTIEWIFLISGGITVAYMTKLYIAIFIEQNQNAKLQQKYDDMHKYMNKESTFALFVSAILLPIMGFFPSVVMDGLADRGTTLMNAGLLEEKIQYFSLENLKGAMISILIGAVLYLFVVRTLLMRNTKNGKEYVDRWPKWMDLENSFYRPLISFICIIGGFFSRVCDSLVDWIVVILRKTIYCDRPLPFELTQGTQLTYHVGHMLNTLQDIKSGKGKEAKEGEPENSDETDNKKDFIHVLALRHLEWKENKVVISRTMSFGLLLFCIGFILTTVYLLLAFK